MKNTEKEMGEKDVSKMKNLFYNFYFDETFHDRKITVNEEGVLNIFAEEKNDSYIGVFWGYPETKNAMVRNQFDELEKKYIERFGLVNEFKSTVIRRKNFIQGIKSFNENTFDFYSDFFKNLVNIEPIIHVNVTSKIELLLRNVFEMKVLNQMVFVVPNAFIYSMTKFILTYHTPRLLETLYNASEAGEVVLFKDELSNHLGKVIMALEGIPRKGRELPALMELEIIISNHEIWKTIDNKQDFIYYQNFDGFGYLLKEKKILPKKINLLLDKEEKTYQTAKKYRYNKVGQTDSEEDICVRVADHLSGFIGKMMYALVNDSSFKEDTVLEIERLKENDIVRKHLLNAKWFEFQKKHFELYKLVCKVFIHQQAAYWSVMTSSYGDQVVMLYSLLRYIDSFENYEKFIKISPELHAEKYNEACCLELERHYKEL